MYVLGILITIAVIYFGYTEVMRGEYLALGKEISRQPDEWNKIIASSANSTVITINIAGRQYNGTDETIYMSDTMELMCPVSIISEMFSCSANIYDESSLKITRGMDVLQLNLDDNTIVQNGQAGIETAEFVHNQQGYFVSASGIAKVLGYSYKWDSSINQATFINQISDKEILPGRYNYEEEGRIGGAKNQGQLGTCWAFAALTALESSLMPEENIDFSEDHMSLNNSYNLNQSEGGDYEMAIAYLAGWQGPVLEQDDAYGDGVTNPDLKAVKHVQDVQIASSKDYQEIKKMILEYGGVQSSIYAASTTNTKLIYSPYFNQKNNSYCYTGDEEPNHDIVIIGWDDAYSKDNFNQNVQADGAFICRNSWGESFGENGDFYVSYYDTNIGISNVAYTKVEDTDNYDNIYQSDLCGWVGQIGYGRSEAYFANVYTSRSEEELKAVSFYATDANTQYSIYFCDNFKNADSLTRRGDPVVSGTFNNAGYYTVNLDKTIHLNKGQRYAIIIKIKTPDTERPVAIEFKNDYQTSTVDISDGEGYVSLKGIEWENTEQQHGCNVCLKAFTDNAED